MLQNEQGDSTSKSLTFSLAAMVQVLCIKCIQEAVYSSPGLAYPAAQHNENIDRYKQQISTVSICYAYQVA